MRKTLSDFGRRSRQIVRNEVIPLSTDSGDKMATPVRFSYLLMTSSLGDYILQNCSWNSEYQRPSMLIHVQSFYTKKK